MICAEELLISIRLEGRIEAASYAAPEFTICPAKAEFSKDVTPSDTKNTPCVDSKSFITVTPGATGVTGVTGSGVTGAVGSGVTRVSTTNASPSSPKHEESNVSDKTAIIRFNLFFICFIFCLEDYEITKKNQPRVVD